MKKVIFAAVLMMVSILSSCSDEDGDWPPIKWKTSVVTNKEGKVVVPSQGASYVFICTNYTPWVDQMSEIIDGQEVYYQRSYADGNSNVSSPWVTSLEKDNTITITVAPNETGKEREMAVSFTAGDVFDYFVFQQEAAK